MKPFFPLVRWLAFWACGVSFAGATCGASPPSSLYMVQLDGPSAVEVQAEQRASGASLAAVQGAVRGHLTDLQQDQEHLLSTLRQAGVDGPAISRLQRVYNGVTLHLTPSQVHLVKRMDGVLAVHAVTPKRLTNSTSVPFLQVSSVWQSLAVTGDGVRIGIIDTGVDYLHTDFGGSGLPADYAANDTTVNGDGFFPSAKVVGGWDFVGDAYDASSPNPALRIPMPDPDPMDCNGHGTHVAGTAAGFGVSAGGSTYAGAYDTTTPFDSLAIGPGVAPRAQLYALRVFGCNGETAVVEEALEWAVDPNGDGDFSDRLDIVNLSLTAPLASPDDPTAVAAENAVLAGIVVVASAGNDGGTHFVLGSPAVATGAIAVAATWDPDPIFPARAVRVTSPAELAGAHQAGGANFGPALVEPGVSGEAVMADPLDACTPLQNAAVDIDGHIAIVQRSDACSYVTQVRHAQQAGTAGAAAVVIVNDRPGLEGVFNDGTGGDITIPPLMIRQETGQRLLDALPGQVAVTLTPIVLEDMFAIFSSRGPRQGDLLTKPDLAAPGVAITSARVGNASSGGTDGMILSGTSMASPHVAGTAALLLEQHSDWTLAQVKARLMNTSRDVFFDPEQTSPRVGAPQMGAGRIDPPAALLGGSTLVSDTDGMAVGLTFGAPQLTVSPAEGGSPILVQRSARLHNGTGETVTYDFSVELLSPMPGAVVTTGLASLTLESGASGTVSLNLELDPTLLRHTHDPALEEATIGFPRHWMAELAGLLVATPRSGGDVPLRLPFYSAPRAASDMALASTELELPTGDVGSAEILLAGQGLNQGEGTPEDTVSVVTPLELLASEQEAAGSPFPGVAQFGVHSDLAARGSVDESRLFFGLQASPELTWSTPQEVQASIWIDTDQDGFANFRLRNADQGAPFNFLTDALVSALADLEEGGEILGPSLNLLSPQDRNTAPFVSDVMVLAIDASDLGLSDGASQFDVAVDLTRRSGGGSIASPGLSDPVFGGAVPMPEAVRTYNAAMPGLRFQHGSGEPIVPDLDGTTLDVTFDAVALAESSSLGILLLHHHNGANRAEVISLRAQEADVALTAEAPATVAPGRRWQTTWRVNNRGRLFASDVEVRFQLPEGVTFEPETSDDACVLDDPTTVLCLLGDLAAGEVRPLELGLRLAGDVVAGLDVNVLGQVFTASRDLAPLNDHATSTVRVSRVVLMVSKEIMSGDLLPGGTVVYQLHVQNQGPDPWLDLDGAELLDVLPAALELQSATASVGIVELDRPSDTLRWDGTVPSGSSVIIDLTATINAPGNDVDVVNQATAFVDSDGDGTPDVEIPSDDPGQTGATDVTTFRVGGLFFGGFETGTTGQWSTVVSDKADFQ